MMKYLIGLDVGTSGAKALLIDQEGTVLADSTREYPLLTPRPNWAEQHPADWWEASHGAIADVIGASGVDPSDIAGVGLSGQMHGSVFLDADNRVIRPAILWCDQRTAAQCEALTEEIGEETVVAETLNPILTGFQAPKIRWLADEEPGNYARVAMVLLPKDYIRFMLTGEFATEVSDASGTCLLNVPKRRWSGPMLDGLGLDASKLPRVYESPEVSGRINAGAAALTGLLEGTPVVGGAGDQAAGAVGNGIVRPGLISVTTGTSGVVFVYLDEPLMDEQLRTHTFCHAVPGKWHTMGAMLSAGGSLRWMRDSFCDAEVGIAYNMGVDPYALMTAQAAQAPLGCNGLIFLPYLTGERCPYPDPHARGVFFGLNLTHDKRHVIRAVLEGVTFGLRDCFELIAGLGVEFTQVRASGGGSRSKFWRQVQADVLRHAICTINVDQGAAYGVALLAAVGAGLYDNVAAATDAAISVVDTTTPDTGRSEAYEGYYAIYRGLYQDLRARFVDLAQLVT